jgi:hypothetical protein
LLGCAGVFGRNLIEGHSVLGMNGIFTRQGLPAPDSEVDQSRLRFEGSGISPNALGSQDGSAHTGEWIEDDVALIEL